MSCDKERVGYGQRGTVVRLGVTIDGGPTLDPTADKEKVKQATKAYIKFFFIVCLLIIFRHIQDRIYRLLLLSHI